MSKAISYSENRIKSLRNHMQELELDAFITIDSANLRWLTAWSGVFDGEQAHLGLVTKRKASLHTDSRYSTAMKSKNKQDLWQVSDERIRHFAFVHKQLSASRKQMIRLGFEPSMRLDVYKALKKEFAKTSVKLVEMKDVLGQLRAVKDDEEVKILKSAQKITDAAFAELLQWIKPGMSELEIANRLDFTLRDKGAQELAFATIAASGPHAALPHARPTSRRLRKGDFLTLDFGARYNDYCADMTRTLVVGKATSKHQRIYNAVLEAHNAGKAAIKVGVTGKEVHEAAVACLKTAKLDEYFTHALGHGVGIEVHEQPTLSPLNTKELVAGNVVTVEPGVYIPRYGGVRIEDCGLVAATGFKSFARSPRELIEIKD